MAKTPAAVVAVGEREVRVSQPRPRDLRGDRAHAGDHQAAGLRVLRRPSATPLMRAIGDRPTAMERWPDGWREGMRLVHRPQDATATASTRSGCPRAPPTSSRPSAITFPSGRTAERAVPHRAGRAGLGRADGHADVPPVARAAAGRRPPRRAAARSRPATRRTPSPTHGGSPTSPASCWPSWACAAIPRPAATAASTSTSGSSPTDTFEDVRHAAIGFGRELERRDGGVTTNWWKEERGERIFLDFNQNNRDRTIASAWSLRARPGAPVSTPLTLGAAGRVSDPREFNLFTRSPSYLADGDPWADMDERRPSRSIRCSSCGRRCPAAS